MALAAVSCEISTQTTNRTGNNLLEYTMNIYDKFAKCPAEDLSLLLTLDEYMKLPEEEQNKPEWDNFRSKLEHYSDTYMKIRSKGITVDTRGVSLRETGSYWLITVINQSKDSESSGYDKYWFDQYSTAPGHGEVKQVTCTGKDQYEIIDVKGGKDAMFLSLTALPSQYGGYDFTGNGSGQIARNEKGISSKYVLDQFIYNKVISTEEGTGGTTVTTRYQTSEFHIRLDTYNNGNALDWCELYMKPGESGYDTNLEVIFRHPIE